MSDVNVENKTLNSNEVTNRPRILIEENETLLDSLLDDKSFTSIENLKDIDNDDTVIDSSYVTDNEDKKATFFDLIKSDNNSSNETDNDDNILKEGNIKDVLYGHHRIASIDENETELVDGLVNNRLLKRIKSNDSLELKHNKSMIKLENLEDLTIDSAETPIENSIKTILHDSIDISSYESLSNWLGSTPELNVLNNNDNVNSVNKNTIDSKNITSSSVFKPTIKTNDNSNNSLSSIKENKTCDGRIDLDAVFNNRKKNGSIKYNTVSNCISLKSDDDEILLSKKKNLSNDNLKILDNGSSSLILKSSLKKISMFSSEYNSLPRKNCHVHIMDSVTIINPREEDKRLSFRKGAIYGIKAIRKSLSNNSVKNLGRNSNCSTPTSSSSKLGVIITTELLNDVEDNSKNNTPKTEDNNHLSATPSHSKVDKIFNHCRRLSFSKLGKGSSSNSSSNENSSNSSKNDYRKDIEKMRKKYALVDEKPKSKYFTLMKLLDIQSTEEEFLALTSLEVYYKNIEILPNEIGDMINLRHLYLNDNRIKYVPPDIGKLTNLMHLDFSFNNLTSIPKEIGNLKNLRKLILNSNKLTELPEEIGSITELKILSLQNNLLISLPNTMIKLQNLTELNISKNKIKKLPEEFNEMKKRCKIKL